MENRLDNLALHQMAGLEDYEKSLNTKIPHEKVLNLKIGLEWSIEVQDIEHSS